MSLLEKIRHFLKPKTIEDLSSINQDTSQKFVVQLAKLTRLIEIYIKKEAALDKLLKDWDKKNFDELMQIMDTLKNEIIAEWGSLDEFEKTISAVPSGPLLSLKNNLSGLRYNYIEQIKIISKKEELFNDKVSIARLCQEILSEQYCLAQIFDFESRYSEELNRVVVLGIPNIAELFESSSSQKNALYYFIARCVDFIKTKGIKSVLVTDDSARILGIVLLDQLKQQNLKVPIFGINPRIIQNPQVYKKNSTLQDLLDSIVTERRAMIKTIIGNSILIIDEFGVTGDSLFASKKFFETLGAKKVYTALFSGGWDEYKFTPDILPAQNNMPDWTHKPSGGRAKFIERPNNLRTRTNILSSKYKVMNDFHQQLLKDYREFMKKIARGEIK